MTINFEDDVRQLDAPQLSKVSQLAQRFHALTAQIETAEGVLKALAEQKRALEEKELPDAVVELGVKRLDLADGSQVTVGTEYYATIPKANLSAALDWLRAAGYADLIKSSYAVTFGKGEDERANQFGKMLAAEHLPNSFTVGVHPQTLRSFVKEQIEAGCVVPEDLLGVHSIN